MSNTTNQLEALRTIETFCARTVCCGGILTQADITKRDTLQASTGMSYDAHEGRFEPLTECRYGRADSACDCGFCRRSRA